MESPTNSPIIWEGGHYYASKGPTQWSVKGWKLMQQLMAAHDHSLLFIDDIHGVELLSPEEQSAEVLPFSPNPNHQVLESAMMQTALDVLTELKGLSKKKAARQSPSGSWFVSGFPLTKPDGTPLCGLLDAALAVTKSNLGYTSGVNVLPFYYASQQVQVGHVLKKVLPEFALQSLYFDAQGQLLSPLEVTAAFSSLNPLKS